MAEKGSRESNLSFFSDFFYRDLKVMAKVKGGSNNIACHVFKTFLIMGPNGIAALRI
jgi:hypothetical protein